MSEYGDNIISISDDEGNDFELLVLDEADMNGVHYLALTEAKNPEEEENLEVIILKVIQEYIEIDEEEFELDIKNSNIGGEGTTSEIVANIPIKRVKKCRETDIEQYECRQVSLPAFCSMGRKEDLWKFQKTS